MLAPPFYRRWDGQWCSWGCASRWVASRWGHCHLLSHSLEQSSDVVGLGERSDHLRAVARTRQLRFATLHFSHNPDMYVTVCAEHAGK